MLVTSQSSKSSHLETRTRINSPCGFFKSTLSQNIVLKTAHSASNSGRRSIWRNPTYPVVKIANNRYCCSSMATSGSLKSQQSARANSSTDMFQWCIYVSLCKSCCARTRQWHYLVLTWSPVRCWRWRNAACSSCTAPVWTLSSPRRCFQGEPVGSKAPHGSVTRLGGSHGQPVHRIISRLNYIQRQTTHNIVRMADETDTKKIVSASPFENWRIPPGHRFNRKKIKNVKKCKNVKKTN